MALGLLPLLVAEVVLRFLGAGADLSLVIPRPNEPGWYQLNPRFDQPYYGQADLSGPEPRPFRLPKPKGGRRILVVGGSTVIGFPYASDLAFPRHIELMLQAQVEPGETIEVLNAGITALNSSAEVAVVAEGLRADPDAIVVYTGHNEFYGPCGVGSTAGWLSPGWYRAIAQCRRLYLVQALTRLMTSRRAPVDLMESLPADLHIAHAGTTFAAGLTRFQANLDDMARLAQRAGVPIVFVSPVANEGHQPPIEDLRARHVPAGPDSWQEKLRVGERQLMWGDKPRGLKLLESAQSDCADDPLIRFRLGQAFAWAGRAKDAAEQFQRALDLDGCRFRAPSEFRTAMQAVAARAGRNSHYLDLYPTLANGEPLAVPGRTHFLEHVHFTWEGNRAVGQTIARFLWQNVWKRTWSGDREPDEAAVGNSLAVQPEDHLAATSLAMMVYQQLPFRDSADSAQLAKDLAHDSLSEFQRLPAERRKLFEQLNAGEMSGELVDALIRKSREAGNDALYGHWLRVRAVRRPWQSDAAAELNAWLQNQR